jgi:hypothetical protein
VAMAKLASNELVIPLVLINGAGVRDLHKQGNRSHHEGRIVRMKQGDCHFQAYCADDHCAASCWFWGYKVLGPAELT